MERVDLAPHGRDRRAEDNEVKLQKGRACGLGWRLHSKYHNGHFCGRLVERLLFLTVKNGTRDPGKPVHRNHVDGQAKFPVSEENAVAHLC